MQCYLEQRYFGSHEMEKKLTMKKGNYKRNVGLLVRGQTA